MALFKRRKKTGTDDTASIGRSAVAVLEGTRGKARKKIPWATNAPGHWPKVFCEPLDPNGNKPMNDIHFAAELKTSLERGKNVELKALLRNFLAEDGVLEVPMLVEDNGQKVPVFYYPAPDVEAANHFNAILGLFKERGMPAVYFSPKMLPPATGKVNPAGEFLAGHLRKAEESQPAESYATWWSTDEEPSFPGSRSWSHLDRAFTALDGVESYVLAAILRISGYLGDEYQNVGQVELTPETSFFGLEGPEEVIVILTVSREKGLKFAFPESAAVGYRELFLKNFADYCENAREEILRQGGELNDYDDDSGYGKPIGWWRGICQTSKQIESEGGRMKAFGSLF